MQKLKEFEQDGLSKGLKKNLFVVLIISIISFFLIAFLTIQISFSVRDYFYKKEVATLDKNFFLQEKVQKDKKDLNSYSYFDEDEEFVGIPIKEAMRQVVKEYSKK